ncbi:MAG: hypothetical protein J1E57_04910 [Prevotella sp.]|nr:hypothetical protein [Prevotella sp.]
MKSSFIVKIWRTGGFIINTNIEFDKQYYNQSGHGACIFGKVKALQDLHFEDELWLQDTKYSLPDDMVMFYKLYLMGNIIAMNRKVRFLHLDAGTSIVNQNRKLQNIYASARNGFIFWHRFIYKCRDKKCLSIICIIRRVFFTLFFSLLKGLVKLDLCYFIVYLKAYINAYKYIRSMSYKKIPPIKTSKI